MNINAETLSINGREYVPKDSAQAVAVNTDGLAYCIVRTYSAGVFAGYVKSREGKEAVVLNARRLWRWEGAASLSQMAVSGTSKPRECKFPTEVPSVTLTEVIEILPCAEAARLSIASVPVWTA